MNDINTLLRITLICLLLPAIGHGQKFDNSFIQYHRSVEDIRVHETESMRSWIGQNANDTLFWNRENLKVDEMPRFIGCENIKENALERKRCADNKMLQFIYNNLVYPVEALEDRIEGRVIISFYVNPDGLISNAMIKKDLGAYTGGAALDVIEKMNEERVWIPGKSNGVLLPVLFTLPVTFKLWPENNIEHPKMYSKYYETSDDWILIYDPEGAKTFDEEAEVRMLISENGEVLNTRIYSPLSKGALQKTDEIILDLLNHSTWKPGSTHQFENKMEYVFTIKL